jgi:hypothetical protein
LEDTWNVEMMFNIFTIDDSIVGTNLALNFWSCENMTIYYNVFINPMNDTAVVVEGNSDVNVLWYDETLEIGNHYSDWSGSGTYLVPGSVGSIDLYPFIDIDEDTLTEWQEVIVYFTNPFEADSDMDGLTDGEEVNTYGTDPLSDDSDSDGLKDGEEVNNHGTSPTNPDSDGDGHSDYEEVQAGTDPLDPNDFPKDAPVGLILGLILGLGVPLGAAVLLVVLARKGKFKLPFIKKK